MKGYKLWQLALAVVLIYFGCYTMGWLDFSSADEILGVGAIVAGALIVLNQ